MSHQDGSLVAARLAGATNGVSDTRALELNVTRRADAAYLNDVADITLALYNSVGNGPFLELASGPLVISSVHRAALYVGEVLPTPLATVGVPSISDVCVKFAIL